jgi:glycosyltransferase involved in cell wall biosynthesis
MLTVLLATKNRARILRDVLESYCNLLPPESGWKLIVIDNGSTYETRQVVESFTHRLPVEYILEPTPGKNSALNAGLRKLEGDLAVFTDDDAFPRRDWLQQLRKSADTHRDFSIFGGPVIPRWEITPPSWMPWLEIGPAYGMNDSSLREGPLVGPALWNVIGPNMAVRSSIFFGGIRFDTTIGPQGANYVMGSETELVLRLAGYGQKVWYALDAVVEHLVREEQLNQEWVFRRAFRFGRGCQRLAPDSKTWFGAPRHFFRDIPKELILIAAAAVSLRHETLFRARWRLNFLRGKLSEARALARERHAASQITSSAG